MAWVRSVGILGLVSACVFTPVLAYAADDQPTDGDETGSTEAEKGTDTKTEPARDTSGDDSPVEEEGKEYHFVGLRYRGIIVPKFIENIFADGGRTVYVNAIGPEFVIRKDNFEFGLSPWLAFYSMDWTAFKGSSDPPQGWELVKSNIKILYLTSDFTWSHPVSPQFAVNYGFGAGLGIVFGDLNRVQTWPNGATDPNKYTPCIAPGNPAAAGDYCDTKNNHYGNYSESSWINGGSKPNIFPWLAAQTGFRFKPSKSFQARLDLGFGLSGFFFGLGADYGL